MVGSGHSKLPLQVGAQMAGSQPPGLAQRTFCVWAQTKAAVEMATISVTKMGREGRAIVLVVRRAELSLGNVVSWWLGLNASPLESLFVVVVFLGHSNFADRS